MQHSVTECLLAQGCKNKAGKLAGQHHQQGK